MNNDDERSDWDFWLPFTPEQIKMAWNEMWGDPATCTDAEGDEQSA